MTLRVSSVVLKQPGREDDRADPEHDDDEALAGAVELLLQRGWFPLGCFE